MKRQARAESDWSDRPQEFSLILGGPLYQLLRRAHLSDGDLHLIPRRIAAAICVTWLPLLLLALAEGTAWGTNPSVPFLRDFEAHSRFLLALPLLIFAERAVHERMRLLVAQFLERNIIPEKSLDQFRSIVESALALRNSVAAEIVLILFVYVFGVAVRQNIAIETSTWSTIAMEKHHVLTLAGVWFGYVSLPIFQFILLRWYFRIAIWVRFLWQVSRLDLDLIPTHPDRAGGLGFLNTTVHSYIPLLTAHGVLLFGLIANRIHYAGAKLPDFKFEIAILVAFLLIVVLGPLLVFVPLLAAARREGLRDYGNLAERYARKFEMKWRRGGASPSDELLGSADVQSLADMGNSYDVVRTMRHAPFNKEAILQLSAATLLPIAPLLLTMMSLEEVAKSLLGIIF